MFPLSEFTSALALTAIVIGLAWLILPILDPRATVWRVMLLAGTLALAWRYIFWRFAETVPPFAWTVDALFGWSFAVLEALTVVSSTSAFFILTRVKNRSDEADAFAGWWPADAPPRVDVYITSYNEDLEVLERTIVGAKSLDHPGTRVFVLDDGRRDWLRVVCEGHRVGYIARSDNAHAKAGNINHAYASRRRDGDPPDFVAILDADFVPHVNFVDRVLALFHDPQVGLVQTPQHFFNPDPVQHNLGITAAYPDEQRHFFDNVEPSRDAWGIAICCGTSSMVRSRALDAIGGFPTESVTEDFLLTLRLAENGWRTVYLNEPLTEGLAPEGLQEYVVQRGRWCLGLMQIARNIYNPFGRHGLGILHRLSVFDSFLYWVTTFPFRLASLVCPLLYWWFGITVVNASPVDIIAYFAPYYFSVIFVLNWLSKGLFVPVLNDVTQLIGAWPITRAAAMGLFSRGPHKFTVTAKGGDRDRVVVQWPMMLPFLVLMGLSVGGLVAPLVFEQSFTHTTTSGDGLAVVMFWTLYNIIVLLVAIAACIERPRTNEPLRQTLRPIQLRVGGHSYRGWLIDLGVDSARLSGPYGLAVGDEATLCIPSLGEISARVVSITLDGYRLALSPTAEQRDKIIVDLYTAGATPGTDRGDIGKMIQELAKSLSR